MNPYKEFSTSWAAYEADAARRGQQTGTAYNAQVYHQTQQANSSALDWSGGSYGGSVPQGAPSMSGPRGPAQPMRAAFTLVYLGIIALAVCPAAIWIAVRADSLWAGLFGFVALVWGLGRISRTNTGERVITWTGRGLLALLAFHWIAVPVLDWAPLSTADAALMEGWRALTAGYLEVPAVQAMLSLIGA